jgi:hypothetical protein
MMAGEGEQVSPSCRMVMPYSVQSHGIPNLFWYIFMLALVGFDLLWIWHCFAGTNTAWIMHLNRVARWRSQAALQRRAWAFFPFLKHVMKSPCPLVQDMIWCLFACEVLGMTYGWFISMPWGSGLMNKWSLSCFWGLQSCFHWKKTFPSPLAR